MSRHHDAIVAQQFSPRAQAYVTSSVHASGPDLDRLEAIARGHPDARALDLGCGGGHAAYRLAAHVRSVVACDLSAAMLAAVDAEATRRGIGNITTVEAAAERLPFVDGEFDMLVCRMSAHHWRDLGGGLREARRVLRTGAAAIVIDVVAPGDRAADTHLQAVELLRDPSHVRDYRLDQWSAALADARFDLRELRTHSLPMVFEDWTARMRTPPAHVEAIRSLQRAASSEVRETFAVQADGSFDIKVATFEAVAS
jgi:SAM-dependent methyltransferase